MNNIINDILSKYLYELSSDITLKDIEFDIINGLYETNQYDVYHKPLIKDTNYKIQYNDDRTDVHFSILHNGYWKHLIHPIW